MMSYLRGIPDRGLQHTSFTRDCPIKHFMPILFHFIPKSRRLTYLLSDLTANIYISCGIHGHEVSLQNSISYLLSKSTSAAEAPTISFIHKYMNILNIHTFHCSGELTSNRFVTITRCQISPRHSRSQLRVSFTRGKQNSASSSHL